MLPNFSTNFVMKVLCRLVPVHRPHWALAGVRKVPSSGIIWVDGSKMATLISIWREVCRDWVQKIRDPRAPCLKALVRLPHGVVSIQASTNPYIWEALQKFKMPGPADLWIFNTMREVFRFLKSRGQWSWGLEKGILISKGRERFPSMSKWACLKTDSKDCGSHMYLCSL